jgi:hypothetical protein
MVHLSKNAIEGKVMFISSSRFIQTVKDKVSVWHNTGKQWVVIHEFEY